MKRQNFMEFGLARRDQRYQRIARDKTTIALLRTGRYRSGSMTTPFGTPSPRTRLFWTLVLFLGGLVPGFANGLVTLDSFPQDQQLYPRDVASNTAEVVVSGSFDADHLQAVHLRVSREGKSWQSFQAKAKNDRTPFTFRVRLPAELANFTFELRAQDETGIWHDITAARKVVAGDVFVINGQSNAAAGLFSTPGEGKADANDFVRSYGSMFKEDTDKPWPNLDAWSVVRAECRPFSQFTACAGRWGLRFASKLVAGEQVPVAIINHARGGKPIEYFTPNPTNALDLTTNYGTLLTRLQKAGLDDSIRGLLWYQGESDRLDPQGHIDGFTALFQDWQAAFPSIERYYVFQIRHTCVPRDKELGQGSQIANFQREFARDRTHVTAVPTTGLDGHDGCHFKYFEGYQRMGDTVARMVRGDLYEPTLADADAPEIQSVKRVGPRSLELTFGAANTLRGEEGFEALFELNNHQTGTVYPIVDGSVVDGKAVRLTLKDPAPEDADLRLSYLSLPGEQAWLTTNSGIGILSFFKVPVDAP